MYLQYDIDRILVFQRSLISIPTRTVSAGNETECYIYFQASGRNSGLEITCKWMKSKSKVGDVCGVKIHFIKFKLFLFHIYLLNP